MLTPPFADWPKIPYVGIGCIVARRGDGHLLMVRNHRGLWSTPGGHLDFGESIETCAARETWEETGVTVANVEFVAVTNDVLADAGKHYVTVWLRADADHDAIATVSDPAEIAEVGWYAAGALPSPLHPYCENLLAGRSLPHAPANLPFARPI